MLKEALEEELVVPDIFGQMIKNWYASENMPRHKVLSLFSGGGGLDIAFHEAGFDIVAMVEKDATCIRTLTRNSVAGGMLDGAIPIHADITSYNPKFDFNIDFIIGGPPCQSFSAAGRRMAGVLGTSSENGKLFTHYVRILRKLKPKAFLFENVLGLLSAEKGKGWQKMKASFIRAGYTPYVHVLDAADYGVPQHRERVIVIGVRDGVFKFPAPTHGPRSTSGLSYYTAFNALNWPSSDFDELPDNITTGRYGHLLKDVPPGLNYTFYTERLGHPQPVFSWRSKFSDFLYKADPFEPTRTIKANGGPYSGPFHWDSRPFALSELKRLQTFPDGYAVEGNRRSAFRQLGNAVPPQLGRILAIAIRHQIFNEDIPTFIEYLPVGNDTKLYRPKHLKASIYKAKAQVGLCKLKSSVRNTDQAWEATRYLSENYGWRTRAVNEEHGFNVKARFLSKSWQIKVGKLKNVATEKTYVIKLTAAGDKNWPLSIKEVNVTATDLSFDTFTACWKAFEEILELRTGLRDIVQLSGYYYYPQLLDIQLTVPSGTNMPVWFCLVGKIMSGTGVGRVYTKNELAKQWRVKQLERYLLLLRKLGFEVRSHFINPQIPVDSYLVPYKFPTLSPTTPQRLKPLLGEK